jgi:hypothetical protein
MTQPKQGQRSKHGPNPAAPPTDDLKKQAALAEQKEVAGRHKNSGQKDHKGAR